MLSYPYPEGYTVPKFIKFNGKQGNAREHVVRFVETLGIHGTNLILRLREFSMSLTDRAYSWYVNLTPNSIRSWEEMVNKFHAKFFPAAEKRFQDKAVDCHEAVEESYLDQICVEGALNMYKMLLVNHKMPTFSTLIEASRNINVPQSQEIGFKTSYKSSFKSSRGPSVTAASASSTRKSQAEEFRGQKRKNCEDDTPFPCSVKEVKALVKEWVAGGELKLPRIEELLPKKDREGPNYCVFHRSLGHPIEKCRTLKKIFRKKVEADELEFKEQGPQNILEDVAMMVYDGHSLSSW
ncbi:uncharacterized protein LOC114313030 [Camellia sinensis]|uniref:uncharacterized protein LOC114313030 n=1 Tax=Camellia sinensis TaxID=4442 RepID=UPI001035DF03|nr:uncharacterized protein LOC114313030 [Camellia sinensis]